MLQARVCDVSHKPTNLTTHFTPPELNLFSSHYLYCPNYYPCLPVLPVLLTLLLLPSLLARIPLLPLLLLLPLLPLPPLLPLLPLLFLPLLLGVDLRCPGGDILRQTLIYAHTHHLQPNHLTRAWSYSGGIEYCTL